MRGHKLTSTRHGIYQSIEVDDSIVHICSSLLGGMF